ncbi:MAG: hypothetical protein J6M30_03110 [Bacteroidales bacterium]|nr:hypothetical protein [Bacteroidales bacterium]
MFRSIVFFVLLTAVATALYGQYHISGDNDSRINYRQIKTEKFHIVYPDYYERNAQRLAAVMDTVVTVANKSLKTSSPRVPILIHTQSAISNGLSVWAPKRMEFWTTTPPGSYAFPYAWQLALHEYRHTCQMQAVNTGITKILGSVFGEHILGAVAGIFVPDWFFEGDAVVAETSLAPAGRGQEPEYNMYLKAQVLDKGRYTSDKMLLGSMKDFVPDNYNLGYFLISYGRRMYGRDIWGDCLHHIGTSWWKFSLWGRTDKERQNLNFNNMYNGVIDTLERIWVDQDIEYLKNKDNNPVKQWGEIDSKDYVNYKNPVQINDSTVLALRSSAYEVQTLVKITNDKEEIILRMPYLMHSYFQYRDGNILYSQYSPNIRWQHEANADIMEYNLNTNKFRNVTSKSTFFTPIYYPEDSLIAAIYTDSTDNQNLAFIAPDTTYFKNRNILKKNNSSYVRIISNDKNLTYSYPVWQADSPYMYVIESSSQGKRVLRLDVTTHDTQYVCPPSYDNIKYLKICNNRLFFIKDVSNKYQLLSINLDDYSDVKIHTDSRYGIDNYCIYDSLITLSNYTANGYKIVSLPYKERKFNIDSKSEDLYFTAFNRQQEQFMLCDSVINFGTVYPSRKYSKTSHLFDFHSWAPLFLNVQSKEVGIGVSAFSQNLLSSSVLEFGYKHNLHDKDEIYMRYSYSGLYPIMELYTSYRPRSLRKDLDSNQVRYVDWDEISAGYDISLPFSWTNRNYRNSINLKFSYSLHSIINDKSKIRLDVFNALGYTISVSNYSAMAANDLYPRTGHITTVKYTHTLTSWVANIFAVQTQVFVPSVARNHSLVLTGSFQKNTPDVYYFPNEVNFVRGVYNMYPKYYAGLLMQYCFPLLYPDNGVTGVFYIKRVTARPFYHLGSFDKEFYSSYGTDVEAKVHFFGITIPVNVGFRIGYCPDNDNTFASFLFSIDL